MRILTVLPKFTQPALSEFQNLYERLIPHDHMLRILLELIDFSFILNELKDKYCPDNGRNAESPVRLFKYLILKVLFKLSDADLVERSKYDMSFKYFLGYRPEDDVIHPSTLTKFRKLRLKDKKLLDLLIRKSLEVALAKGIIKSRAIIVDSTHTRSRYNQKSAYDMLMDAAKSLRKTVYQCGGDEQKKIMPEKISSGEFEDAMDYCAKLVETIQEQETLYFYPPVKERLHYLKELIEDAEEHTLLSKDEDARLGHKTADSSFFGYKTHIAMTEERLITAAVITGGEKSDGQQLETLVEKTREAGVEVDTVIGDTAYSGKKNLELAESKENPAKAFDLVSKLNPIISNSYKNPERDGFTYNKDAGMFVCPEGYMAIRKARTGCKNTACNQSQTYYFDTKKCEHCPRAGNCWKAGAASKTYSVTIKSGLHKQQAEYQESAEFKEKARTRYKIEAKNSELKRRYGYDVAYSFGMEAMEIQGATTIFVANMKRIVKLMRMK